MRDPLKWLPMRKQPISASERAKLIAAGYKPDNHPNWATLEWLDLRKREALVEHYSSLDQYKPWVENPV